MKILRLTCALAAEVFVLYATWTIPHAARRETVRLRDSDAGYDRWGHSGESAGLVSFCLPTEAELMVGWPLP